MDKPSGILTVSGIDKTNQSLAQAVYEAIETDLSDPDRMVLHRLGMDTSGLVVFAKTLPAVRGMNELFRIRAIERQYEAMVCGTMVRDRGLVDVPLMRCYQYPPYMRVSTEEHQEVLLGLDPDLVDKVVLEQPKESLTKYQVLSRNETINGQPVTRVTLNSLSGRTHQLNVHMAALGHAIVGDTVYGVNGIAASNGGLTDAELRYMVPNKQRATVEQQRGANAANITSNGPLVHAKLLRFRHPVTKQEITLTSEAPF